MKQTLIFLLTGWFLFALTSCDSKNETVKFLIFSDIHNDLIPDGEKRLQKILKTAEAEKVDFVIELGDFCHPGANNDSFMKIWNDFPKDKYHVLGNHDMDRCSKEEYIQSKNMPGRYYSFDRGEFHFIVLDANNRFENGEYIPYHKGGYSRPTSDYIDDEQIEWLRKDLAVTEKQCIIFSHQSLEIVVKNRDVIQRIFEQENKQAGFKKIVAAFSGHDHTNYSKEINGISYVQINSASYFWVGEEYESDKRYTKEINEKYPYLKYTIPYEETLYGIITLDQNALRLKGAETTFMPPTPLELGMPEALYSYPVVPYIKNMSIFCMQNEGKHSWH